MLIYRGNVCRVDCWEVPCVTLRSVVLSSVDPDVKQSKFGVRHCVMSSGGTVEQEWTGRRYSPHS